MQNGGTVPGDKVHRIRTGDRTCVILAIVAKPFRRRLWIPTETKRVSGMVD